MCRLYYLGEAFTATVHGEIISFYFSCNIDILKIKIKYLHGNAITGTRK
jgi:hypothetical protein